MDWAVQDLRWAHKLATCCAYDGTIGAKLHQVIAELGQLAGWLAFDLGLEQDSRRYFLDALRAAHSASDRELGAYVVSCMSYQAIWTGPGCDTLRLIRIARKSMAGEPPGLRQALLATREARAHAVLGDQDSCQRALDTAAEFSRYNDGHQGASWAYWLTPAVMMAGAGRAWLDLGMPDRAEWHLARGLEMFGEEQPRNRLLHSASLAEARLAQREVDGAVAAAMAALDLADHLPSLRARIRFSNLRRQFLRHDNAVAREVVQRIDAHLGPTSVQNAGGPSMSVKPREGSDGKGGENTARCSHITRVAGGAGSHAHRS
ncbi:hypothetical protein Srufu_068840 [Streptomyces libani subsp. rufus]|nr:hypothetical protein Srufu_068840 [Streptomyces libani subsp. rufus]